MRFDAGRVHGIVGPPGSGKSLLLHLLGLLEPPDAGEIELFGQLVSSEPVEIRQAVRNAIFGYVFSEPCLLPALTVAQNVAMPLFRFSDASDAAVSDRVREVLGDLDIIDLASTPCADLSPLQARQVALGRALIHRPRVLAVISPEPSTGLPSLLRKCADRDGITCLWCAGSVASCDQVVEIQNGRVRVGEGA